MKHNENRKLSKANVSNIAQSHKTTFDNIKIILEDHISYLIIPKYFPT